MRWRIKWRTFQEAGKGEVRRQWQADPPDILKSFSTVRTVWWCHPTHQGRHYWNGLTTKEILWSLTFWSELIYLCSFSSHWFFLPFLSHYSSRCINDFTAQYILLCCKINIINNTSAQRQPFCGDLEAHTVAWEKEFLLTYSFPEDRNFIVNDGLFVCVKYLQCDV